MTRLLFLLAAVALLAQAPPPRGSAVDLYHAGAQAYIDGDNAQALQSVDAGLAIAPDDPKLTALRELLEPPEQDPQDGGQDQESEDPQDGDEGEPNPDAPPQDDPSGDGQDAKSDQAPNDPAEAQSGEAPPQPAGREPQAMTRAQAERILDAVGGEEELLLRELRRAPTQRSRSDKDW